MGENTVHAALDLPALYFYIFIIARAVQIIEGTIAEQAVYIHAAFMAGIVFTFLICKKTA